MRLQLSSHCVRIAGRREPLIEGISLAFEAERCHCVVGVNGVGKTSFLMSLTRRGALRSETGESVPATYFSSRDSISAEKIELGRFARLFSPALDLERWGLGRGRQDVNKLSQGEKMRLILATAAAVDPEVLLLDEPTLGLDSEGETLLRSFIAERAARGRMTIVSSHDLTAFDVAECRIIYLRRDGERATVTDGDDRLRSATGELLLDDGSRVPVAGPLATIARELVQRQIEAFG